MHHQFYRVNNVCYQSLVEARIAAHKSGEYGADSPIETLKVLEHDGAYYLPFKVATFGTIPGPVLEMFHKMGPEEFFRLRDAFDTMAR